MVARYCFDTCTCLGDLLRKTSALSRREDEKGREKDRLCSMKTLFGTLKTSLTIGNGSSSLLVFQARFPHVIYIKIMAWVWKSSVLVTFERRAVSW